jgi:chorismate mutase
MLKGTMPTLANLGERLKEVDDLTLLLMWRRFKIALEVGACKMRTGDKISRPSVESRRLQQVDDLAVRLGVDPHFARTLLYFVIGESCKVQMKQLQDSNEVAVLNKGSVQEELVHRLRGLADRLEAGGE